MFKGRDEKLNKKLHQIRRGVYRLLIVIWVVFLPTQNINLTSNQPKRTKLSYIFFDKNRGKKVNTL